LIICFRRDFGFLNNTLLAAEGAPPRATQFEFSIKQYWLKTAKGSTANGVFETPAKTPTMLASLILQIKAKQPAFKARPLGD